MIRRILAATDGSAGADRAIDFAASLAKTYEAHLFIFTVQEDLPREAIDAFKTVEHVAEGDVREFAARATLVRAVERARHAGLTHCDSRFTVGDPTREILEFAKQNEIDTIVVGKRGRGTLAGLLLGSVSHKLVSLALCNVIVVP